MGVWVQALDVSSTGINRERFLVSTAMRSAGRAVKIGDQGKGDGHGRHAAHAAVHVERLESDRIENPTTRMTEVTINARPTEEKA